MRKVLSKEVVLEDASKYNSISEWSKNSRSCYVVASRNKWLEEATSKMNRGRRSSWTESEILVDALRFDKMIDWINNSPSAYQAAWKMGAIERIRVEMLPRSRSDLIWSSVSVLKDSSLYKTKSKWEKASPSAYNASRKLGIHLDATKHMPDRSSNSSDEIEILNHVLKDFPNATKKMFKNESDTFSFWGLELDIFVPSLNKGIEFDGTYWHSFEGLKKSRPSWSDEDIKNYHLIKDTYFLSIGIPILHIKEENWKKDKLGCLNRINIFLRS